MVFIWYDLFMLGKLKQAGQMAKVANQARKMQKELEKEEIVVEENGIKVVMGGGVTMQCKEFTVNGVSNPEVVKVLNKAMKKTTEETAKKMQSMMGGMGEMMKGMGMG